MIQKRLHGQIPHRSIVVTFDDGYADNLHQAKPLLEKYHVPATIFVTAGLIGQPQGFWGDILEQIFLQPGNLPESLALTVKKHDYHWKLDSFAHYSKADYQQYRHWNVLMEEEPTFRHTLYRSLHR